MSIDTCGGSSEPQPRPAATTTLWALLIALYGLWAALFIARSSFIAIDGKRYFSLFDDAMIAMRYARNFALGRGLVWNPGERIEGFTNLAWTLVMTVPNRFLPRPLAVLSIQLIGVLIAIGTALLAARLANIVAERCGLPSGRRSLVSTLALVATLSYYPLSYWNIMGMESGPLALVVTAMVIAAFLHDQSPTLKKRLFIGACISLSFALRPDGILYGAPIAVYLFFASSATPLSVRFRQLVEVWALPALIVACITAFRFAYFGALVPNTYVLKVVGVPLGVRIHDGMVYVTLYLITTSALLLLAVVPIILYRSREAALVLSMVGLSVIYQVWVGGDPFPLWRQMVPTAPLLMAAAATGALALGARFGSRPQALQTKWVVIGTALVAVGAAWVAVKSGIGSFYSFPAFAWIAPAVQRVTGVSHARLIAYPAVIVVVLGTVSVLVAIAYRTGPRSRARAMVVLPVAAALALACAPFVGEILAFTPHESRDNALNVNKALVLNTILPAGSTIGVYWAGATPYYTDFKAYDFLGKADARIARLQPHIVDRWGWPGTPSMHTIPGHNKYDLDYSIRQVQPTYVEFFKFWTEDVTPWAREHYDNVEYRGIPVFIRRGALSEKWRSLIATWPAE